MRRVCTGTLVYYEQTIRLSEQNVLRARLCSTNYSGLSELRQAGWCKLKLVLKAPGFVA
jgi:hypothetical protein